jgi:hypothetical protein
MGVAEMVKIAELIDRVLSRPDEETLADVRREAEELTDAYPLYQARPAGTSLDGARKTRGAAPAPVGAHR